MGKMHMTMTVNGRRVEALAEPRPLFVRFLREELRLTGAHIGCETAHCGACTVDLGAKSVKSCTVFVTQANGAEVTTIEAMAAADGTLHVLQEMFREHHGLPYGWCTPGMIMRAHRLLQENPAPTEAELRFRLSRNLCRCTGLPEHRRGGAGRRSHAEREAGGGGMNAITRTAAERTANLKGLGTARKRIEDVRFTQGKGNDVDDIALPGMLCGDFVRSPHAHAHVVSVNKEVALATPGVIAVLTAENLALLGLHWMPTSGGDEQMMLADGKVLFQGQEVVFVVALDRYNAADTVEQVEVEQEDLPVVVDPFEALEPDAPVLREDLAGKTKGAHGPRRHHNHIFIWEQGD